MNSDSGVKLSVIVKMERNGHVLSCGEGIIDLGKVNNPNDLRVESEEAMLKAIDEFNTYGLSRLGIRPEHLGIQAGVA